jgi:hypothetical protein
MARAGQADQAQRRSGLLGGADTFNLLSLPQRAGRRNSIQAGLHPFFRPPTSAHMLRVAGWCERERAR